MVLAPVLVVQWRRINGVPQHVQLQCPSALLAQCSSMLHIRLMRIMLAACQRDVALQQLNRVHVCAHLLQVPSFVCTATHWHPTHL
jgi:hypothetical protein